MSAGTGGDWGASGDWTIHPITNRPIANRQSPIANRQSPIANRQSNHPITNRQSLNNRPITNRQSPILQARLS
jgi:hypothetical protein